MFGVGPTYLFVLQHRLPVGLMRSSWHFWLSTMATNLDRGTRRDDAKSKNRLQPNGLKVVHG
jgi:hypothetical protein